MARKEQEIVAKEAALEKLGGERTRLTATRDEKQDERKVGGWVLGPLGGLVGTATSRGSLLPCSTPNHY